MEVGQSRPSQIFRMPASRLIGGRPVRYGKDSWNINMCQRADKAVAGQAFQDHEVAGGWPTLSADLGLDAHSLLPHVAHNCRLKKYVSAALGENSRPAGVPPAHLAAAQVALCSRRRAIPRRLFS